jgi:hypothetical protein
MHNDQSEKGNGTWENWLGRKATTDKGQLNLILGSFIENGEVTLLFS